MALVEKRGWDRVQLVGVLPLRNGRRVTRSTVLNWCNGVGRPDLVSALAIAREFEVPLDYLADDTMDVPPEPELTKDERFIIDLIRWAEFSRDTVVRLLKHGLPKGKTFPLVAVPEQAPEPVPVSPSGKKPRRQGS